MKKFGKILLIVFILGALIFLVGLATAGFKFENLTSGGKYQSKEWKTEEQVTSILVDTDNAKIELLSEAGDGVRVDYEENDRYKIEIGLSEGVLSIRSKGVPKYKEWFSFGVKAAKVNVYIGEEYMKGYFSSVSVRSRNGDVKSELALFADTLRFETDNGDVTLKNGSAKNDVTLTSDNGDVTAKNVAAGGNFSAETDNGAVKLEEVSAGKALRGETDNGDVKGTDLLAPSIRLTSDNGDVKGSLFGADKIELETDNGDITVEIADKKSEYKITADTEIGKCNLTDTAEGSKILTVKTEIGDIDVTFTKE